MKNRKQLINRITKVGIFGAIAVVLYDFIKFPLPFFPSFLEINFSMLPIILIALIYGPIDASLLVIIRFLLKLPISHTAYVGEIGDLIIGLLVVVPTGLIYQINRTKKGGIISLVIAFIVWTVAGSLSNIITIPIYLQMFFDNSVEKLLEALTVIKNVNSTNYMMKYLFYAALPFNALIAFVVCLITYFVYKRISLIFKHDFLKEKTKKEKVMVMVDSFKGTLSSIEAGTIIKEELIKKNYQVDMIPISDGGEGFLEVIKTIKKLDYLSALVHDAIGRTHQARYLYDEKNQTAYVELGETCGINNLQKNELAPYDASSYGLGEQIKLVIERHHPLKLVVGIGGSASSDAGSGMLEALGANFYDKNNEPLHSMNNRKLGLVEKIHIGSVRLLFQNIEVEVLTDVTNQLLGENGAVYVFGPQKGAKTEDLEVMETNMSHFVKIVESQVFGDRPSNTIGEGAAGGVGYAFNQIIRAKIVSGSDTILKLIDFKQICNKYDIIVTGEGKFDEQTMDGKIIKGIMQYQPKRMIIIVGSSDITTDKGELFTIVPTICSVEESLANPKESLQKLIKSLKL